MSPINITPIYMLNFPLKSGILSNYAQRFIKSQVKDTTFVYERFFSETYPKLLSQDEQKLKDLGVKQIGKDIYEGIIISDKELDYHIYTQSDGYLCFDFLKPDSNKPYQHFRVKNDSNKYIIAGEIPDSDIEDEMDKALDFASRILNKLKRVYPPVRVPQPFTGQQTTSDKIAELNRTIQRVHNVTEVKNFGIIGSAEEELLKSINDKLSLLQEMYYKISGGRTRYEIRCAYKNYLPQPVANKVGFKDIGPNGESVCYFRTTYKNNAYDAITITDSNGKEFKFVISQDKKSVQKNLPTKSVNSGNSEYRLYITPNYYTQKEIDESGLSLYLCRLSEEMDKFIEHTQNWFNKKEEMRLIRSNYDTATLEQYKDLLDDIHSSFEEYRTKMRKYLRKTYKSRKFKTENNISTKLTSTAVKFDNITPEGDDLRLSYPKIHDKNAMQLLIMRGDEIKNSFYIYNDKLMRFKIKDLNDKFNHYNQNLYYYDKKYLQSSNLQSYLLLVQDKLHELNKKLDVIRKKQIKNKIRYNIKTKKELTESGVTDPKKVKD